MTGNVGSATKKFGITGKLSQIVVVKGKNTLVKRSSLNVVNNVNDLLVVLESQKRLPKYKRDVIIFDEGMSGNLLSYKGYVAISEYLKMSEKESKR